MSEQKYYVKLRNIVDGNQLDNWLVNGAGTMYKHGTVRLSFSTNLVFPNISFTKSELAEIMDGSLYKRATYGTIERTGYLTGWQHVSDDDSLDDEWINPLIELVQV